MAKIQYKLRKCFRVGGRKGKTSYPTEIKARKGLIWIWSHDPSADILDLHVYKCPHGEHFHIGHRSAYEKVLARQAQPEMTQSQNSALSQSASE